MYTIITENTIGKLIAEVNSLINDGWTVQGGAFVTTYEKNENGYIAKYTEFHQAMVKS
jgi:hypothetical protein